MTQTETPTPPPAAPPAATCPTCGNDIDRGQPFCLECGRRLNLDYKKPPSFRIPLALVALLVVALGVAAGFAVTQATQEDDQQPDAITVNDVEDPGIAQREAEQAATPTTPEQPAEVPDWPEGTRAYTVVLLATEDSKIAKATAAKAVANGNAAGLLKGKNFNGLPEKQFFVFSGQYEKQKEATDAARDLSADYPAAAARLIEPKP
jgi:predicted nucleic acid-binding Zn ribbon protein